MANVEIRSARGVEDVAAVRELLREYGEYLAANPTGAANICIPNYQRELAGLPAPYAELLLAEVEGTAAGCVALKPMPGAGDLEVKRLWVRPGFRGLGLGKRLILAAIEHAAAMQAEAVYLDTVPAAMPEANRLYETMGFVRVDRYNDNPVGDVVFFRLELAPAQ